jgi:hypothetical protein
MNKVILKHKKSQNREIGDFEFSINGVEMSLIDYNIQHKRDNPYNSPIELTITIYADPKTSVFEISGDESGDQP